ncbi:tRNA epoxyqueuosine(34) reductase QueG [Butyricimonas sp.]|uniref:tRNA epoxyqueuosine(34) reductase QueG n=1 Tax=Butyricimonas sp. TaxID=1969738 RepID=UPI0025C31239|nr:tRNA epoxyqueuosine(34) reductase QueG [Butyricimonas sp.]
MNLINCLEEARLLGFDACGVAPVDTLTREKEVLLRWIEKGFHAGMGYMAKNIEKRENPALLVEGARSVIVTLTNYYTPRRQEKDAPVIARYAYGKDYHIVLKERLFRLLSVLKEKTGRDIRGRVFVDSAPVFEHEWARRAGLGWIGRNTLLVNPRLGSYCFIGVIISDFEPSGYSLPEERDFCGTCNRCVEACPTGALSSREVNANLCISYNTIERKDEIPLEIKEKMGQRFFGCDACQEVCPWNGKAVMHRVKEFFPDEWLMHMSREDWLELDEETFKSHFKDSPLSRPGLEQIKRNLSQPPLL